MCLYVVSYPSNSYKSVQICWPMSPSPSQALTIFFCTYTSKNIFDMTKQSEKSKQLFVYSEYDYAISNLKMGIQTVHGKCANLEVWQNAYLAALGSNLNRGQISLLQHLTNMLVPLFFSLLKYAETEFCIVAGKIYIYLT